MSNTRNPHTSDTVKPNATRNLALSTTALAVVMFASPALAIDYSYGEVSGSIDTFISAGASMRTSARDCRNLGAPSGGCKILDASGVEKGGGVNTDDGNLNYDQWDVFSGALKATSEVGATWRNFNAFVRGTAFVDPIVDNTDFRDLDSAARSEVSQNAKLLDYFVGGSFDVGGLPLELRGGNQVISWGESTFIQNGINVINPVDISAVRKPGSEVKEFFTPILAAKAALGLPNNFSVEGFYQFKADNIVPDPSGTFFSGADIVGRGSQPIRSGVADFGDDDRFNPFEIRDGLSADITWESRLGINVPSVSIERANDVNADDGGEFGFALRYFNEELNNGMEFGLYFINYHSRLPILTTSMFDLNNAYSVATATNFSAASRAANALTQKNGVTPATALENLPFNVGIGTGPVSGTGPGRVPGNIIESAQMLCNALAPLGGALAAQGVGSATPGAPLGTLGSVNFNTPGGTTNCNSLTLMRTGAADLERNFAALAANSSNFRLEYPEDIKLVGASMSTTLGSLAFQAEATYRHDQPLSYVGAEVAALANDLSGLTAFYTGARLPVGTGPGQAPAGSLATTYSHAPTRFSLRNSRGNNETAAISGAPGDNLYTFAEAAALQDAPQANGVKAYPGALVTPGLTPTPGLIAAADKAKTGTLTVADLPGAFFVGGVNTGPSGVIAGTGGTVVGPAGGAGALLGLGGVTNSATVPGGVVFPAGTAASLVATSNLKGVISLDVEQLASVPALAGGQTLATNVANGRAADVQVVRNADSGVDGQALIPVTPQTRSSSLTAANVRPDGFIEIPTEDVFTAQSTITSVLFGSNPLVQFASADGGAVVTEVGMVWVPGISTSSAIASASGSEGLLNPIAAATYRLNTELKGPTNYATSFSWGATGIFNLTYNRVFGSPVNLVPQVAWKWDIGGRTPSPLGNYMAERKAIGLSLAANYQSRWTGSVSWTANFGPDSPLDDRDFASVNIAYAF